ncbi:MAG TPA: TIGR02677 family protein [Acidimicrobiales bacterium]|nr:TIGR02677 family protein [Acidimicrobiales bacterium]
MSSDDDAARRLFRYIAGDEWREYRAIMGVFAGTFFSEFTPEEVTARLRDSEGTGTGTGGVDLDPGVVADRLESLRRWGNLTVSSAVGNPTSIADYYRRRNRYLITRAGQEVHGVVEGVLSRVDEVRDVSTSRLRALHDALRALDAADVSRLDTVALADLVRAVFDPHEAFTSEISQFFAAINQWQSRYDLSPEEFRFFAEVLVSYVAERLDEIERTSRPIGRLLAGLAPRVATIVERANRGLASRVEDAGLTGAVAVTRMAGSTVDDWDLLAGWFVARGGRSSRIERLGREAVSAIRTLTLNLARLSRVGIGASSRRADFLRLAEFFARAAPDDVPRLAAAAFGLHPSNHWGVPADDAGDPVSTATPWRAAPRAPVPVSLRERGDTTNRGRATPLRDRSLEQLAVRHRRARELDAARRVDAELVLAAEVDGRTLSRAALARLEGLVGAALHRLGVRGGRSTHGDGAVRCTVERTPGRDTRVSSPDGTLTLAGLRVTVAPSTGGNGAAAESALPAATATPPVPAGGPTRVGDTTPAPGTTAAPVATGAAASRGGQLDVG